MERSEVGFRIRMDFRRTLQLLDIPPVISTVLPGRERIRGACQSKLMGQDDIMRPKGGIIEDIVLVDMIKNTDKAGRMNALLHAKLVCDHPVQGWIEFLILINAPTWHEPKTFCRGIAALPEQYLTALVVYDQIDRYERCRADHMAEICWAELISVAHGV